MYSIKAHAKVNIFLKITGHKDGYHTLISRFIKVQNLYDTIEFIPEKCDKFTIEGCNDIDLETNTIYKAYKALNDETGDLDILNFFYNHKVVVSKKIPSGAGLGGGSSDAAAFMRLVKEVCKLLISTKDLAKLGSTIGADIPFFIYNYNSANVSGFGEVVKEFKEAPVDIELKTPNIHCDTTKVYNIYRDNFLDSIEHCSFLNWEQMNSKDLLESIVDPYILNDLYSAATMAYPKLKETIQAQEGWFFSGSGSSFFKLKEKI